MAYALTLRNAGPDALLSLGSEGLPSGYVASFAVDGSTVSSLRAARDSTRAVTVTIKIPQGATRDVGRSVAFVVTALAEGAVIARLPLNIEVKGQPQLELQGQNWFATVAPGTPAEVSIDLVNTGTAPALAITLSATKPLGWIVTFAPPKIERLEPGNTTSVRVSVAPAQDAGSGKYVVDVSGGTSDISARPRSLSVEVSATRSAKWPWVVGAAAAAAGGIGLVIFFRRR